MMNGGILALSLLFLLTLASQGSWCAAVSSISADHHLQVQEFHGKKKLEIDIPRKLRHGQSLTKHEDEVSAVEIKHHRRMVIGHKGGSVGGGAAGGGGSGRNMGGGGVATRPHKKNGAAALPVPVASVLVLSLASGLALSLFSF